MMDPDVTAKNLGRRIITRKPEAAMNRNQRVLVQKDNILPLILPPVKRNVIALKISLSIPKMERVLKSLQRGHALKER